MEAGRCGRVSGFSSGVEPADNRLHGHPGVLYHRADGARDLETAGTDPEVGVVACAAYAVDRGRFELCNSDTDTASIEQRWVIDRVDRSTDIYQFLASQDPDVRQQCTFLLDDVTPFEEEHGPTVDAGLNANMEMR